MSVTRALTLARRILTASAVTAIAATCLVTSVGTTSTARGHHRGDVAHATKEWKAPSTRDVTLATKEWKIAISSPGTTGQW
jgi:hypothetical protein